ncbi:sigma-70 family RNA polymerase sigma factor [Cellulomonas sp. FA1]|uniref:sigma-70 family RNA polymerase sigma factor n=3 Tax=Cellulomonas TaxID=1707 RepID=UPI000625C2E1|nr:sigma-70 family RNA polymerase sigma factor [Cellulomonas sp. FA1]
MAAGTEVDGVIEDDAALLRATRAGDAQAFGHLYERHAGAALVVARQYTDGPADAEDVVADAFANVHRALLRGGGPEVAFRAYLFTVVRRVAAVHRTAGRRTQPTDDVATLETASTPVEAAEEPTLAGFERGVVARAFRSLPERWQAVLWHSEVEGLTPAQIAPLLGLTANSAAALAYRAREGLRQAYLQMHLQDPLDDGCRGASGKLGAYVRGGLGARDTRTVEQHLDACGECRALVLELGDVNHGMRAVVAPLVLGLLGLGALAHPFPVGGGLAAGAAALGQGAGAGATGGTAAGGSSAGTSSAGGAGGAGGTGAAAGGSAVGGTGVGGAAAAGSAAAVTAAGGTAAVSTAGAASAGGVAATTGLAGLLAGASTTAIAAVAAAVVVVAVAVVGATQLLQGRDEAGAPGAQVSGATGDATPRATPRATGAATPTDVPSATPSDVPTATPTPDASPTPGPSTPDPATADPRPVPTGVPVVDPGPDPDPTADPPPTPEPTSEPTPEPTAGPTPGPTPTPTPPGPAQVVVGGPTGGFSLAAGADGQELSFTVENTGGVPTAGLTAQVDVPAGVSLVVGGGPGAVAFGFGPATGWLCVVGDAETTATCTLEGLAPGASATLGMGVRIDEAFRPSPGDAVRVAVTGDGGAWDPVAIPLVVAASPARVVPGAGMPTAVQLVAGRTTTLDVPVRNAGGTGVTGDAPATVTLALPAGVTATGAAPWSCDPPRSGSTTCRHGALGAFDATTLALTLATARDTAPGAGTVALRFGPSASRPVATASVATTVVRPATLVLDAPAAVDVAPGTAAPVTVRVTNAGDLPATGAALRWQVPPGVTVADGYAPGWRCDQAEGVTACVGDLAAGAHVDLTARLSAAPGAVGDVGGLALTLDGRAADADVPAPRAVVAVTVVPPQLTVGDAAAVVDLKGGGVAFVVRVAGERSDGRPAAAAADVTATVTLPPGVTADRAGVTSAGCAGTGRVVTCALGDLAAGASVPVQVGARAAAAVRGTVDVRVTATGVPPVTTSAPVVVSSANLTPVWSGVGDLDVVEVGAPLLVCHDPYAGQPCAAVRQDRDNNGLDMRPVDQAPPPGERPGAPVSSETRVDVPDGRPVVFAGLYWSGVRGPSDAWSTALGTARLRGPDGTWTTVTADPDDVVRVTDNKDRRYYQSAVDVTDLVAAQGAGTWALADAAVSQTRTDREPTYYAGWALVVVHGTVGADTAAGRSAVTVHQGGSWVGTSSAAPAFLFTGAPGTRTRIGVVGWEGDRATTGDRLTLSGVGALTPRRWNGAAVVGGGSAANAFDSTATGWRYPNALGVDAKGFEEVTMPTSGVGTLTASTGGDQYLLGVVTVRTGAPAAAPAPLG